MIREYGEEKFAPRIATRICEARKNAPIERTTELAELIKEAIPAAARREGGHPAKRTFQAIRIEVNGELSILRQAVLDISTKIRWSTSRLTRRTRWSISRADARESSDWLMTFWIC